MAVERVWPQFKRGTHSRQTEKAYGDPCAYAAYTTHIYTPPEDMRFHLQTLRQDTFQLKKWEFFSNPPRVEEVWTAMEVT